MRRIRLRSSAVSEQLLTILKLCLLALLYLFFFRVLRAVWAELRIARRLLPPPAGAGAGRGRCPHPSPPAPAAPPATRRRAVLPTELVATDPAERRGTTYPIGDRAHRRPGRRLRHLPARRHLRLQPARPRLRRRRPGAGRGPRVDQRHLPQPGEGHLAGAAAAGRPPPGRQHRARGRGDRAQLRAGGVTDVGRVRQINQDTPLVADAAGLWAVADGMGGHRGGEVASDLAVRALQRSFAGGAAPPTPSSRRPPPPTPPSSTPPSEDPELRGMGTTLVAIARTDDDELAYVNVGDSRIYLLRDGELSRLTIDHSLVEELVREGSITAEEARTHPKRNIVTRALGIDPCGADRLRHDHPLRAATASCSAPTASSTRSTTTASPPSCAASADPGDAAAELVRLANEGGGRDNITVLDPRRRRRRRAGRGGSACPRRAAGDLPTSPASVPPATTPRSTPRLPPTTSGAAAADAARRRTAHEASAPPHVAGRPSSCSWSSSSSAAAPAPSASYARGTYYVGFDGETASPSSRASPAACSGSSPTVIERTDLHPRRRAARAGRSARAKASRSATVADALHLPEVGHHHDHVHDVDHDLHHDAPTTSVGVPAVPPTLHPVIALVRRRTELGLIVLALVDHGGGLRARRPRARRRRCPPTSGRSSASSSGCWSPPTSPPAASPRAPTASCCRWPPSSTASATCSSPASTRPPRTRAASPACRRCGPALGVGAYVATLLVVRRAATCPLRTSTWRWSAGSPCCCCRSLRCSATTINGARIWVELGPVGFQPGEFAKIALADLLRRLPGRATARCSASPPCTRSTSGRCSSPGAPRSW